MLSKSYSLYIMLFSLSLSNILSAFFTNPVYICSEFRAKLVDLALASGKIFEGEGFKYIKESFKTGTLHFIGLLSDGGVHSRIDQLLVCFLVED